MKNQSIMMFLALWLLSGSILAAGANQSHLKKKPVEQPFYEEYSHFDESQQVMETPEWAPSDAENTMVSPQEIPEEMAEANQSGAELEEPLSKITK